MSASLEWRFKASPRQYAEQANDILEVPGKATCADDGIAFSPATSPHLSGSGERESRFGWEVKFEACDCLLSVTLKDAWVIVALSGTASSTAVDPVPYRWLQSPC